MCETLSLTHICKHCQAIYFKPSLFKRQLNATTIVYSFYKYEEIKEFIHTKHSDLGYYIYKLLAQNSLKLFSETFTFENSIAVIAIDDHVKSGYSHTALLADSLKSRTIKPRHARLRASSPLSYSGKSREFRLNNPRDFTLKKFKEKEVILVDDIITTGSTLTQAIEILNAADKEVLFCLTLCDLQNI